MSGPRVDRPLVPDGYGTATESLSWATVESELTNALHYWLSTVAPEGSPHVVPRWGVWLEEAFWYDGSPETRHVRNLTDNPKCALHLGDGVAATGWPSATLAVALQLRSWAEPSRKWQLGAGPARFGELGGSTVDRVPTQVRAWL